MDICHKIFYSDTLMKIVQKGIEHMGLDDAHKDHIAGLAGGTWETPRNQWFERMHKEVDAKPDDQ